MEKKDEKSRKGKAIRKVTVRFTQEEYLKINTGFQQTSLKKLSQYIRLVLLEKPITVYTRSQSLDHFIAEMIVLRKELSAIGNNLNQAVKRLHSMSHFNELKTWVVANEISKGKFFGKVEEIKQKIKQISDKWLPE